MEESLLVSLALGDGHLSYNKSKVRAKLIIRHSNHQFDYIWWKYNLCPDLWNSEPKPYKNINKGKRYYGHCLRSHLDMKLAEIKNIMYPEGKKRYTREVLDLLDERGLAIWYMDDGCIDRPRGRNPMGLLNTYGSSPEGEEEKVVQEYFRDRWDINCSLNKNHGRYRIRFPYRDLCKLKEVISPYVIGSLKYKLNTTMRQSAPAKVTK